MNSHERIWDNDHVRVGHITNGKKHLAPEIRRRNLDDTPTPEDVGALIVFVNLLLKMADEADRGSQ
jgi:hypothetical protein